MSEEALDHTEPLLRRRSPRQALEAFDAAQGDPRRSRGDRTRNREGAFNIAAAGAPALHAGFDEKVDRTSETGAGASATMVSTPSTESASI